MNAERRNQIVLTALVVVLAAALYRAFTVSGTVSEPGSVSAERPDASRGSATPGLVAAPDVRLESLDADRARPAGTERNLFRFGARPVAARRTEESRLPPPPVPVQSAPTTPSVAPITLKFIGVVQATVQAQTYAVLRDDRGVYHGREGDIIEGRYRILRIGTESIELAYVNGTGRQTIRLGS